MPRIAWITDPHLNFLAPEDIIVFLRRVAAQQPDIVLLGGDIGEAHNVLSYLDLIEHVLQRPVYLVLGNHDFYRGSIAQIRRSVQNRAARSAHLTYLPAADVISLTPDVALIGVDGWGDARIGDFENSHVILNDFLLIEELRIPRKAALRERLHALGDEAAEQVRRLLPAALESHRRVILLTHVPPFKEACWHQGGISDDNFLPFFTCRAVGDALLEIMGAHPDRELTVLCGHSHGEGRAQMLDNLRVITGGVEYGDPQVQRLWDVE